MASFWLRFCMVVSLAFVLLLTGLIMKTLSIRRPESKLKSCRSDDEDFIALDKLAIDRFRTGLTMPTVSYSKRNYNRKELDRIVQYIVESYPTLHSSKHVTWERVGNYSLLYYVTGSNPNLRPYLLMGHLDVVPANAEDWDHPPFGAEIHDGFIYARGAFDDKHTIFGILEAVEFILKHRIPQRSFYIAFGHDEEVHGLDGARTIARNLQDSGAELEFILDEGFTITKNMVPFVDKAIACIGVTEKGYLTVKMSTNVTGGHSSMPPPVSSIGIIANAITRLENNAQPSMFGTGPEIGLLEHLAPEVSFPLQVILTNLWLFGPILSRIMSQYPHLNALIRTTTSVTMFNAGIKENVLAPYAEAVVNHRIHPSQTVNEVLEYDRKVINDDRIRLDIMWTFEAHPVSDYGDDSFGYQTIRSTIQQILGRNEVLVIPGTLMGNTDTIHYLNLTKNIYRFSPAVLEKGDLKRFHGVNERISVKNFEQVINFYYHLIINSDSGNLASSFHSQTFHGDL